jgi:chromosome segregation ATPase
LAWKQAVKLLKARVSKLEEDKAAMKSDLDDAFEAFGRENTAIQRLKKAEEELTHLHAHPAQPNIRTSVAAIDFGALVEQMKVALTPVFCTVEQFSTRNAASSLPDLAARLVTCEGELFNSAGLVQTLSDRVQTLKAARSISAIEVGGFVFVDVLYGSLGAYPQRRRPAPIRTRFPVVLLVGGPQVQDG